MSKEEERKVSIYILDTAVDARTKAGGTQGSPSTCWNSLLVMRQIALARHDVNKEATNLMGEELKMKD